MSGDWDAQVEGFVRLYGDVSTPAGLVEVRLNRSLFVVANRAFEELLGAAPLDGRDVDEFRDPLDPFDSIAGRRRVLGGDAEVLGRAARYRSADGRIVDVAAFAVVIARDDDRALLLARFQEPARVDLQWWSNRRQDMFTAALAEIRGALLRRDPPDEVLRSICLHAQSLLAADHAGLLTLEDSETLRIAVVDRGEDDAAVGRRFALTDVEFGDVLHSRRTRQYEVPRATLASVPADLPGADPGRPMYVAVAPVLAAGRTLGVLAVRRSRAPYADDELELLEAFAREVSDAMGLAELRADHERLRIVETREEIARNLHDEVTQDLIAVRLGLLHQIPRVADAELRAQLTDSLEDLDTATRRLRDVVAGLDRTSTAEDFTDVVRSITASKAERGDLDWSVHVTGAVVLLGDDERAEILRVVNEGVSNVLRHARASQVNVELDINRDRATVRVCDDGVGLQGESARRSGLANLCARARSRRGDSTLASRPEGGSVLSWWIPLAAPTSD